MIVEIIDIVDLKVANVCVSSDPEVAVPGVPVVQRVGDPVPDELRAVRAQHGLGAVLPAAGRLPGHPGDRVERGQLRPGAPRFPVLAAVAAGPVA